MTYYMATIYKDKKIVNAKTFTNMDELYEWVDLRKGELLEIATQII